MHIVNRTCLPLGSLLIAGLLAACAGESPGITKDTPATPAGATTPALGSPASPAAAPASPTPSPAAPVAKVPSPAPAVTMAASPVPARTQPPPSPSPSPSLAPDTVTFVARDPVFSGPSTIPAGWTPIRLVNEGQEPHHIQLLKLDDGRTRDDWVAAMSNNPSQRQPDWVTEMGGPNTIPSEREATAYVNLTPGNYLLVDLVPGPDGVPHVAQGMIMDLEVVPDSGRLGEAPLSTELIEGVDFAFNISPEMSAGNHMFRFANAGDQVHEVLLVRLDGGATIEEWVQALVPNATGAPPGDPLGGITAIEAQGEQFFPAELRPGTYGLVCFLRDPQTGQPHNELGMMRDFTVR